MTVGLTDRFWTRVERTDTCWLWTAPCDREGYGRFAGRNAHRVAYEALVGPVPHGLELDHLCRVRECCNPSHLEPVTHAENVRRGDSPAALNMAKTHCIHGHEFTEANTRIATDGHRKCRACDRIRKASTRRKGV